MELLPIAKGPNRPAHGPRLPERDTSTTMFNHTANASSLAILSAFSDALVRLVGAARREEWDEVQTLLSPYTELLSRVERIDWRIAARERAGEVAQALTQAQQLTTELTSLSLGQREVLRESISRGRYERGALAAYISSDR